MENFISVEQARKHILFEIDRVGTERLFLSDASGRYIAESIEAPDNSPPFDNSSRDGFAVRWKDIEPGEVSLDLVGESAAGQAASRPLRSGEAMRISTGAKLPEGADTVVMQEHADVSGDTVNIPSPPSDGEGAWVRHAGAFLGRGEVVVPKNSKLKAPEIGVLASFRHSRLEVYRRPRVAIVSTGDELVDIDEEPGESQIVNSNAYLLESLLRSAGADPIVMPPVPDNYEATLAAFEKATEAADMVVSSGGVSVGTHDEVHDVVDDLTGGMKFWKIRMKPGKPLAFGTTTGKQSVPLIGLPGNPNSCFVCFHQFLEPALRVARGSTPGDLVERPRLQATLHKKIGTTPRRRTYLAGHLDSDANELQFTPAPLQNSGNVGLFCGQNAFGVVPEGTSELESGETIEVELIDEGYF